MPRRYQRPAVVVPTLVNPSHSHLTISADSEHDETQQVQLASHDHDQSTPPLASVAHVHVQTPHRTGWSLAKLEAHRLERDILASESNNRYAHVADVRTPTAMSAQLTGPTRTQTLILTHDAESPQSVESALQSSSLSRSDLMSHQLISPLSNQSEEPHSVSNPCVSHQLISPLSNQSEEPHSVSNPCVSQDIVEEAATAISSLSPRGRHHSPSQCATDDGLSHQASEQIGLDAERARAGTRSPGTRSPAADSALRLFPLARTPVHLPPALPQLGAAPLHSTLHRFPAPTHVHHHALKSESAEGTGLNGTFQDDTSPRAHAAAGVSATCTVADTDGDVTAPISNSSVSDSAVSSQSLRPRPASALGLMPVRVPPPAQLHSVEKGRIVSQRNRPRRRRASDVDVDTVVSVSESELSTGAREAQYTYVHASRTRTVRSQSLHTGIARHAAATVSGLPHSESSQWPTSPIAMRHALSARSHNHDHDQRSSPSRAVALSGSGHVIDQGSHTLESTGGHVQSTSPSAVRIHRYPHTPSAAASAETTRARARATTRRRASTPICMHMSKPVHMMMVLDPQLDAASSCDLRSHGQQLMAAGATVSNLNLTADVSDDDDDIDDDIDDDDQLLQETQAQAQTQTQAQAQAQAQSMANANVNVNGNGDVGNGHSGQNEQLRRHAYAAEDYSDEGAEEEDEDSEYSEDDSRSEEESSSTSQSDAVGDRDRQQKMLLQRSRTWMQITRAWRTLRRVDGNTLG